jgi:uncharacterized protein (TIGR03067 family)
MTMKPFSVLGAALGSLVMSLGLLVAAPGTKDEKDKEDLKKFEGNWVFASWNHAGEALPAEARDTAKWTIKGDKYTFEFAGMTEEGTIKLDPSKKVPTIDLTITAGNDKGKEQPGIYKIDGDTITFCFARPGGTDRPKDFTSTEDDSNILIVMKRKKEK